MNQRDAARTLGTTAARAATRFCARAGLAASGINPVFNAKATMTNDVRVCVVIARAGMHSGVPRGRMGHGMGQDSSNSPPTRRRHPIHVIRSSRSLC